jgi:hypothetical protein
VEDILRKLEVVTGAMKGHNLRSGAHALWPFFFARDPLEIQKHRARQLMYLGRHARQSVLQWDETDLEEIDQWVETLSEMVGEENAVTRALDGGS